LKKGAEVLVGLLGTRPLTNSSALLLLATDETTYASSDAFLKSKLRYKVVHDYTSAIDVDGDDIGVMMS
jgi:hypothetical protein